MLIDDGCLPPFPATGSSKLLCLRSAAARRFGFTGPLLPVSCARLCLSAAIRSNMAAGPGRALPAPRRLNRRSSDLSRDPGASGKLRGNGGGITRRQTSLIRFVRALIAIAGRLRYVVPTLGVPLACGSEETWPGKALRACPVFLRRKPVRSASPAPERIRGGPLSRPRRRARAATWLCPSDRRISTLHPPTRSVQRTPPLVTQAERRNAQLLVDELIGCCRELLLAP